jgi:hypothetical protein
MVVKKFYKSRSLSDYDYCPASILPINMAVVGNEGTFLLISRLEGTFCIETTCFMGESPRSFTERMPHERFSSHHRTISRIFD